MASVEGEALAHPLDISSAIESPAVKHTWRSVRPGRISWTQRDIDPWIRKDDMGFMLFGCNSHLLNETTLVGSRT